MSRLQSGLKNLGSSTGADSRLGGGLSQAGGLDRNSNKSFEELNLSSPRYPAYGVAAASTRVVATPRAGPGCRARSSRPVRTIIDSSVHHTRSENTLRVPVRPRPPGAPRGRSSSRRGRSAAARPTSSASRTATAP